MMFFYNILIAIVIACVSSAILTWILAIRFEKKNAKASSEKEDRKETSASKTSSKEIEMAPKAAKPSKAIQSHR